MKLTRRNIIFMASGLLLTVGVVACNHGMHFGSAEERGEWLVQKVSNELELNQAQQARLAAVKNEFLDMRKSMHSDRERTRRPASTVIGTLD